jgi:hypothetical protein
MAALRSIALALLALTVPAAADPLFGTWTLVSQANSAAADRCYVTSLEDLGNGKFHETSTRVRFSGEVVKQDTISAFDGADHPSGLGAGITAAFDRIDQNRYVILVKKDGVNFTTVMRTVSDDGNSMTQVANGSVNGKPFSETLVFARKDSTCDTAAAK